jgi:transposase
MGVDASRRSNGYLDALRITSTATSGCIASVLGREQEHTMAAVWIGIDVSKDRLDYCCGAKGTPRAVPNTAAGHRSLLIGLRKHPVAGCIIESTGAYHQGLVETLQASGVPVTVVTPQVIKWYRQSFGRTAKTDALDARLLARYGEMHQPDPSRVPTPNERDLRQLVARREDLVAQLVAEKTRRQQCASTSRLYPFLVEAIATCERHLAAIEQAIEALIGSDPVLAARRAQLRSVPGVGTVISVVLLAYLPELGELDRRQIAALAGLAPLANDSGTRAGTRSCAGGRAPVRKAMYQAALTCVTHPRVPATVYRDQYAEMQPAKGAKRALIAIARRLLVLLNAMVRDGLRWPETEIGQGRHPRPVRCRVLAD